MLSLRSALVLAFAVSAAPAIAAAPSTLSGTTLQSTQLVFPSSPCSISSGSTNFSAPASAVSRTYSGPAGVRNGQTSWVGDTTSGGILTFSTDEGFTDAGSGFVVDLTDSWAGGTFTCDASAWRS